MHSIKFSLSIAVQNTLDGLSGFNGQNDIDFVLLLPIPISFLFFCRMFELTAAIPLSKDLKIKVMDYNFIEADDFVGETAIDLENRLLSKYHATCGLPRSYYS